jgi:hypothetical protein
VPKHIDTLRALTPEQLRVLVATMSARRTHRCLTNRQLFSRYVAAIVATDCDSCGGTGHHGMDEQGFMYSCYACAETGVRRLPKGQIQREAAEQRGWAEERARLREQCPARQWYYGHTEPADNDHSFDDIPF